MKFKKIKSNQKILHITENKHENEATHLWYCSSLGGSRYHRDASSERGREKSRTDRVHSLPLPPGCETLVPARPGCSRKTETTRILVHLGASLRAGKETSLSVMALLDEDLLWQSLIIKQLWDDFSWLIFLYSGWLWMHTPHSRMNQDYIILWRDVRISGDPEGHWLRSEATEVPH